MSRFVAVCNWGRIATSLESIATSVALLANGDRTAVMRGPRTLPLGRSCWSGYSAALNYLCENLAIPGSPDIFEAVEYLKSRRETEPRPITRDGVYSDETKQLHGKVLEAMMGSGDPVPSLRDLAKSVHCDLTGELRLPHGLGKARPITREDVERVASWVERLGIGGAYDCGRHLRNFADREFGK